MVPPWLDCPQRSISSRQQSRLICGYKNAIPSAQLTVASPAQATDLLVFALATPRPIPHLRLYRFTAVGGSLEHRSMCTRPDQRFCDISLSLTVFHTKATRRVCQAHHKFSTMAAPKNVGRVSRCRNVSAIDFGTRIAASDRSLVYANPASLGRKLSLHPFCARIY